MRWPRSFNVAKILLGMREGRVTDWRSHCKNLGFTPPFPNESYARHLIMELILLKAQGVISIEYPADYGGLAYLRDGGNFSIHLNRTAVDWLNLLNISLADLANVDLDKTLVCQPVFPTHERPTADLQTDVFVIMPFGKEFSDIYRKHILKVCAKASLVCRRADEPLSSNAIIADIFQLIQGAKIVVADCTGRNPNVFYELGIAHTLGKRCILLTQSILDMPFDVGHLRHHIYEHTPTGMKLFERTLHALLKTQLSEPSSSVGA